MESVTEESEERNDLDAFKELQVKDSDVSSQPKCQDTIDDNLSLKIDMKKKIDGNGAKKISLMKQVEKKSGSSKPVIAHVKAHLSKQSGKSDSVTATANMVQREGVKDKVKVKSMKTVHGSTNEAITHSSEYPISFHLIRDQAESEGKTAAPKKPILFKYGLINIDFLTEQNMAQFVIIAHDVDPIELVVWLHALCRKIEIPYCIVKGKSRLGTITALCLTTIKNEDKIEFNIILEAIKANFNDKYDEYRKKWGGGIMRSKSQVKTKAKERVLAKEAAQRLT
ncbi:hypothetical protein L2E82_13538 [Cichorium intybus]|uniref:Uncharacterized protein n=1 Tax=Cichorium intybus TaxID=13427 RepID=A0ACB9EYS7_CICIN|nr:hypothetical protein L2E82_13538 [Cichorium intybus]